MVSIFEARQAQPGAFQGIGRQDARPAGVGDDGNPVALQERLVTECQGHIEQLLIELSAQDASLAESSLVGLLGASQRAGVGGHRP